MAEDGLTEEQRLLKKRERINARLRQLKGQHKRTTRQIENRRKALAGAFLLEQAKRQAPVNDWMLRGLAWFLKRPEERALFQLTPQLVTDKGDGGQGQPPELPPEVAGQAGG